MTNLEAYVKEVFKVLHSTPEIGFKEYKTAAFIAGELKKMGYQVIEKINDTGVIGILDSGKPGPIFALRGDIDALEFEKDGEKYHFHGCGHDAHAAMVLAAAKKIIETGIKRGKFYAVFQQAEERLGAVNMIESGYLDEVEEMVGIHLRPIQESRLGQATPALVHGSSKRVDVSIKGLNAHGARPHLGINAVDAAVLLTSAINSIRVDPTVSHSIKVTRLQAGGDAFNTIPDKATLVIDVRVQTNKAMDEIIEKIKVAVEHTAAAVGAVGKIEFIGGCPAAEYEEEMIQQAKEAIEEELGEAMDIIVTPGAEDFHFFTQTLGIKTTYIGLGADLKPGLHHPDMTFDESALIHGVNILFNIAAKKLIDCRSCIITYKEIS